MTMTRSPYLIDPICQDVAERRKAADAIEQQARELAACEGALRNSGNIVRQLNDDVIAARRNIEAYQDIIDKLGKQSHEDAADLASVRREKAELEKVCDRAIEHNHKLDEENEILLTWVRAFRKEASKPERNCTCHPDDNPPRPCPQKFAYSECVKAASEHNDPRMERIAGAFGVGPLAAQDAGSGK